MSDAIAIQLSAIAALLAELLDEMRGLRADLKAARRAGKAKS